MQQTGAKTFYLPSADYIWPHVLNEKVREVVTANGGEIVGEEYFPLDHTDYADTVDKIMSSGTEVVFNTIVPARAHAVPRAALRRRASRSGAGTSSAPTSTRTSSTWCRPSRWRASTAASTTTRTSSDPFSKELLERYDELYPGSAKFTAGSGCSGMYRGLKLWEAAVKEAGSLEQEAVIKALDHARIAEGPGGPAEMVPGQHHVRMNMYIAQAKNGTFKIVKSLGVIDPKECSQGVM